MNQANRPPLLEVRHLRMVDAVARLGSVSAAAKRLNLTQPAVSHALRDLEHRLGVLLFRRERKRMRATPQAERLVVAAERVIAELRQAESDIVELENGSQGLLRLTTECYTCYHWLPSVLREFVDAFPNVSLQIAPEHTNRPFEALREGVIDLAIVTSRGVGRDVIVRPLFSDELVAISAPEHRFSQRQHVLPRDFAEEHLAIHANPKTTVLIQRVLEPAGIVPRRLSELRLTEAVVEMVKANLAVSVMARWAVQPELEAGTIVARRVTARGLRRTWYAAVLRSHAERTAHRALVELLKSRIDA